MTVEAADLEWREGAPVSARFGDSYFSREGGLDESRAVFLAGCGLPEAWARRDLFCVGELGFGTGLNALALWELWRRTRPAGGRLRMVSVEGFPIGVYEAARAHAAFPEVAELSARMRAQWPARAPGAHLLDFPEDGFSLTVLHGEAGAALDAVEGRFDAWFLDGFAPSKNPEMWRGELFTRIAALSAPGARAATFTVAGAARRGLSEAGFTAEKRPGFGRKRERLEAVLTHAPEAARGADPLARGAETAGDVLILGGGIAGCALAHALRARGRGVTIVSDGEGASAVPAAMFTPRLENADRPHQRALFAAFLHAASLYEQAGAFSERGARRMAKDAAEAARLSAIAKFWPGLEISEDGLAIPAAGVLDPARALAALAGDAPRIAARVAEIKREDGVWVLFDADGARIASAPVLVLAGGAGGAAMDTLSPLRLGLSAGQVSIHDGAGLEGAAAWGGFAAPCGGRILLGATHEGVETAAPPAPDAARAAAMADEAAARLGVRIAPEAERIWTGVRAVTADRLPCAGPVPDPAAYAEIFGAAAKGGPAPEVAEGAVLPGLWTLTGLGSRGFAHAPLLARSVASEICGEPSPLEAAGRRALHPARFLWRELRRR